MAHSISETLKSLNITLPEAPAPAANYVPYVVSGNMVYVSGQLPKNDAGLMTGKLGADVDLDTGAKAAEACALALLAQLKEACGGDLDRLKQVVKLTGFVNSTPDFTDHPVVINGASDLIAKICGGKGAHSRVAVGVASLPLGVAVEIDGTFEIE